MDCMSTKQRLADAMIVRQKGIKYVLPADDLNAVNVSESVSEHCMYVNKEGEKHSCDYL
jgi:hypothetical protein